MVMLHSIAGARPLLWMVMAQLLVVLAQENIYGKSDNRSRFQEERAILEHLGQILKVNKQVTVSLKRNETRPFYFLDSEISNHSLSITVIPCSATIEWSVTQKSQFGIVNDSEIMANRKGNIGSYTGNELETITLNMASPALYILQVKTYDRESRISIYVSMDPGGPYDLTIPQDSKLKLVPQRRQKLDVRWEPSLVNPQNTSYCLVVSTAKDHPALCGAEEEGETVKPSKVPITVKLGEPRFRKKQRGSRAVLKKPSPRKPNNDTVVVCVDKKTRLTLTKLKTDQKYYLNLFATNVQTNLTVPYGKSSITYSFTTKSLDLKDGKPRMADLKRFQGKVSFRFKAAEKAQELHLYVLVCGGTVDVQLRRKGEKKREFPLGVSRVDGFQRFVVRQVAKGEYLYLKISSPDSDELTRIKYVEAFATIYPAKKYPFPVLPDKPEVYEYQSTKKCDSVTVGWVLASDTSPTKYCVIVSENYKLDLEDNFRQTYQCPMEHRRSRRHISETCQITTGNKVVTAFTVTKLKPGRSYKIQVNIRKKKGRTLSYKPINVYTKHVCDGR